MLSATTALHQEGVLPARKMHTDEIDISLDMVARLIAGQFPQWAAHPLRRVPSTGTVNALFRLGPDLVVRLCRVPWAAGDEAKEQRWLRQLAPYLPVAIPAPVVVGQPTDEYPWTWSILRWLPGTNPVPGNLTAPGKLAADLAEFVIAFRAIDIPEGPRAYRGGPLARLDEQTRAAIAKLDGTIDTDAATAIWDEALDIPTWERSTHLAPRGPLARQHPDRRWATQRRHRLRDRRHRRPCMRPDRRLDRPARQRPTHLPINGRLRGRYLGPAPAPAHCRFRSGGLYYYRGIEPTLATEARYTIDEVLADSIT